MITKSTQCTSDTFLSTDWSVSDGIATITFTRGTHYVFTKQIMLVIKKDLGGGIFEQQIIQPKETIVSDVTQSISWSVADLQKYDGIYMIYGSL